LAKVSAVDTPPPGPVPDRRTRRPPLSRSKRWAIAAIALGGVLLAGCDSKSLPTFGAFRGSTKQGQDAFKLWQFFFIMGIIVGGIVTILILFAIVTGMIRKRRHGDVMPRQNQYHTLIEILYTVIPIILVLVLFAFTFVTENEVDAVPPHPPVAINVTAFQWGWQFEYPATGKTVIGVETQNPAMVVPANETVRIFLRSNDVIHGFYVPQFNFSRYAQPGITNEFDIDVLQPNQTFRGQCTQFCGLYHSLMLFQVHSLTQSQFQVWVHTSSSSESIASAHAKALNGGH